MWNKFKSDPSILQPLQEGERLYGGDSPFQGVLQMYHISLSVKKTESEKLRWVFDAILDARRAGILKNEEISKTKLLDKGRITPVDLFIFKYDVARELLNPQLAALPFSVATMSKMRHIFKDHRSYRNALGFKDNKEAGWTGSAGDAMWRSSLTKQEDAMNSNHIMSAGGCMRGWRAGRRRVAGVSRGGRGRVAGGSQAGRRRVAGASRRVAGPPPPEAATTHRASRYYTQAQQGQLVVLPMYLPC